MVVRQRGFTLIEAMIVVALIGILVVLGVPYTVSWFHQSDVQRTANTLESAHGRAKSVALRNPQAVTGSQALAAGLKYEEADGSRWLLVCRGDPAQPQCAAGGTATDISVEWRAELPAGVTLTVGGSAMDVHGLNNTGQAVGTGGAIAPLAYEVTKGARSHASELR